MSNRQKKVVGLVVYDGRETAYNPDYHIIKDLNLSGSGYDYEYINSDTALEIGYMYFVDTSSSEITVGLPDNPEQYDRVAIVDYANTFYTNNCTVNSSNPIEGSTDPLILDSSGLTEFIYLDDTIGWKVL